MLSFTCNFFAYFKFHSDLGRVIGKIKENELDCRDTAPLIKVIHSANSRALHDYHAYYGSDVYSYAYGLLCHWIWRSKDSDPKHRNIRDMETTFGQLQREVDEWSESSIESDLGMWFPISSLYLAFNDFAFFKHSFYRKRLLKRVPFLFIFVIRENEILIAEICD